MNIPSNDKNTSFSFITLRMLRNYEKRKDTQFCRRREREQSIRITCNPLLFSNFSFGVQRYEPCLIHV